MAPESNKRSMMSACASMCVRRRVRVIGKDSECLFYLPGTLSIISRTTSDFITCYKKGYFTYNIVKPVYIIARILL